MVVPIDLPRPDKGRTMLHAITAGTMPAHVPTPTRRRSNRPWSPTAAGPYKLPRVVEERLTVALAGFRNREAAFTLAMFLSRFWSAPRKLLAAFPIDRRALAEHEGLGLTEARVRGAIAVLVEVGFLARYEPDPGKRYQRTETGLHRRPILHRFGEEFAVEFGRANAKAQAARGAPAPARRSIAPTAPARPVPAISEIYVDTRTRNHAGPPFLLAQKQTSGGAVVIMGDQGPAEGGEGLEAALARLRAAGGF